MKNKTIITILVLIFGGLIVYNLPYFAEKRAYYKAVKENTIDGYQKYLYDYSDGKHVDEVLFLIMKLEGFNMNNLIDFIQKYPNSTYINEVYAEMDKLWDIEINKFKKQNIESINPQAAKYMTEMLLFMKKNHINTIFVDVEPNVNVKDIEDYDKKTQTLCATLYENDIPFMENIISITSNFSSNDIEDLSSILINGLKRSFDKIFTKGFINFILNDNTYDSYSNEDINKLSKTSPKIRFSYEIKNQEIAFGEQKVPLIWIYGDNYRTISYVIGIEITCNTFFTIPNSSTSYDFTDKGEPEEDISHIGNEASGYREMARICFYKFSNKITKNILGIELEGDSKNIE